jgi:hypothetical protein
VVKLLARRSAMKRIVVISLLTLLFAVPVWAINTQDRSVLPLYMAEDPSFVPPRITWLAKESDVNALSGRIATTEITLTAMEKTFATKIASMEQMFTDRIARLQSELQDLRARMESKDREARLESGSVSNGNATKNGNVEGL